MVAAQASAGADQTQVVGFQLKPGKWRRTPDGRQRRSGLDTSGLSEPAEGFRKAVVTDVAVTSRLAVFVGSSHVNGVLLVDLGRGWFTRPGGPRDAT